MFVKTKGNPNNPTSFEVNVIGFHIMDIGNSGYTEFEYDANQMMDLYAAHPEYMECRMAMLHSHNSMGTFFSNTDIEELEDNTVSTDFMVSLIVNNASKYTAKVAWRTKQEVEIETTGWFKGSAIKSINKRENISLYTVDLDIEIEGIEELVAIDARLLEIEADKEVIRKAAIEARAIQLASRPTFNGRQLDAFPKNRSTVKDDFGLNTLQELKEFNEIEEINNEEIPPFEGQVFDNLLGCLLVLNQQYSGGLIRAMQEVKDKVTIDNIPMLVDMINDNLEDYYEQHYGEVCTMEAYMEFCSAFIKELRNYSPQAFSIVGPLINMLSIEIGDGYELIN